MPGRLAWACLRPPEVRGERSGGNWGKDIGILNAL
jgi:hypothetical protein